MKKIIFVCLGNICRSPMAEFVMKDLVKKSGSSEQFLIESRATSSWEHGNPVHTGTLKVLRKHSIAVDKSKTSCKITHSDFENAHRVIAMDKTNFSDLINLAPEHCKGKIEMLLSKSVPDPWYTGDFDETYQLVKEGCKRILFDETN